MSLCGKTGGEDRADVVGVKLGIDRAVLLSCSDQSSDGGREGVRSVGVIGAHRRLLGCQHVFERPVGLTVIEEIGDPLAQHLARLAPER